MKLTPEQRAEMEEIFEDLGRIAGRTARLSGGRLSADELLQEGIQGFLDCLASYDPARGPLGGYAWSRCVGRMADFARRERWYVPCGSEAHGLGDEEEEPTPVPSEGAREAAQRRVGAVAARAILRVDAHEGGLPGGEGLVAAAAALRAHCESLPERDRKLIAMHLEERDGAEIGAAIGKSKSQANRMLRNALERLRDRVQERGLQPAAAGARTAEPKGAAVVKLHDRGGRP